MRTEGEAIYPIPYGTYYVTDLGEITWYDFTKEIQKALGIILPDRKESLSVFLKSPLFDKTRIE